MDETDAVDALEHLGLTSYEAQVFVALQKLGIGTASDVDRIADVPRSQVYGSAEKLEERGLIEVQQSNPIQYRPVDLDEARKRLRSRYEHREDEAFAYLEDARSNQRDVGEHQEDVWTLHGRDSVAGRTRQLVNDADERILYGSGPETLEDALVTELTEKAANNVSVTVVSATDKVLDSFEGDDVTLSAFPTDLTPEDQETGRILVVDGDTLLLSILGEEELPGLRTETAIWSAETGFAAIIIQLINNWFEKHLDQ